MKKVLFVYGTRPEAIKMAPLIMEFKKRTDLFETKVCVTAQHREMMDQINLFFGIRPDFDLNLMKKDQSLTSLTAEATTSLDLVYKQFTPDLVFVQGDTTTAFLGALIAFYNHIQIAHIEAGLRSFNKLSPYPEEVNRRLISCMADIHFAPTNQAMLNLRQEGIDNNVFVVGNTVVDALLLGLNIVQSQEREVSKQFDYLNFSQKIILVTGHRRESFGQPLNQICQAIKEIAISDSSVQIVYPVHLNPHVQGPVLDILSGIKNIFLINPLGYRELIWLMSKSYLVITDSGGIQEEAPSLGKPVLVTRDVTERMEGVAAGTARLVGTNKEIIINNVLDLLSNQDSYKQMAKSVNPYGDGQTCQRIVDIINQSLNL
ncbi:MAG: UDP-N-acetylglucosamine 2-epimerase (non-hydrolyzing) [Bacilli bacterium]|nr:UDP-N-acetylglucosamine 2-epimerase (non-hydrolyzing) [Bacilli bacterium]